MATGRTHATVAWGLSIPLAMLGAYCYLSGYYDLAIGVWCGTLAGILITPDADLEGTTWEERRIYNLLPLLGLLWQWAWFLYARAVPHRGISHTPVLGTLTRLLYIVAISYLLVWMVNGAWLNYCQIANCTPQTVVIPWHRVNEWTWTGLLFAWVVQDMGHLWMDRKRKRRHHRPNAWPLVFAGAIVAMVIVLHDQGVL